MGRRDAAAALGRLLADPDLPYRARWVPLGTTPRRGRQLNRAAVGRVVAAHLVDVRLLDDVEEQVWPRTKKDWLDRCLDSSKPEADLTLDREALELICDAFGVTAEHRTQLVALVESPPGADSADHTGQPGVDSPPREYHSVWVLEDHYIGADRRPSLHHTTQTVQADIDDLRHITLRFDADCVAVTVEQGGRATGDITRISDNLWGQPIILDRPARRGEQRDLAYTTYFDYTDDPPPEFRRSGGSDPHAYVEIRVHFDAGCLPTEVCHCVWPALDAQPLTEAVTLLDDEHSATMIFNVLQPGGLVGFRWTWPDDGS